MVKERRSYDKEFLVALTEIKADTKNINTRLDKINGSIEDYQTTKEKLSNACGDIEKIVEDLEKNVKPKITTLHIKFYTIVGFTALFSGAVGSAIGAAIIIKVTTGG